MTKRNIKAIALLSGGLDSILAIKVLLDQGVEITGVYFAPPFSNPDESSKSVASEIANKLGIAFRMEEFGDEYLEIVKNPRHGHGTGMNPCIDCKIYMLKRAKQIADETGAELVVTGEVLNQRPMSQHRIALNIIENDSGLKGRLLRPLSAKFLPETNAEEQGRIDRNRLLSINGRSRKEQLTLAKEMGIDIFIPAAGGCILTDKFFTKKIQDILEHNENTNYNGMFILTIGRHFRFGKSKIIAGRNENENNSLYKFRLPGDYIFELPEEVPGPVVVLQGEKNMEAIDLAAALTLRYSDLKQDKAVVRYGENDLNMEIMADIAVIDRTDYCNVSSGKKD
jgi:tRNA-uridine 2-sulfurtransferase